MPQLNHRCKWEMLFVPPKGYNKTDYAVFTTYSVSKGFLCAIPLWMFLGTHPGLRGMHPGRVMRSREFRNMHFENKIRFYYDGNPKFFLDGHSFLNKKSGEYARRIFMECGVGVKQERGLFHPKILILQFSNDAGQKTFRVHISSRNLTGSDYAEAGVTFEAAELGNETLATEIYDFFKNYLDENNKKTGLDWETFRKSKYVIKNGEYITDKFDVHINYPKHRKEYLKQIYADYINVKNRSKDGAMLRVTSMEPSENLFAGMDTQFICNFSDMYEEKDGAFVNKKKGMDWYFIGRSKKGSKKAGKKDVIKYYPKNLHTKQYIVSKKVGEEYHPKYVWIGSANASFNALVSNNNTEAMVRLELTENTENLSKPGGNAGFQSVFGEQEQFMYWNPESVDDSQVELVQFSIDNEEVPKCPKVEVEEAKYESEKLYIRALCKENGVKIRPETLADEYEKELNGNAKWYEWNLSEKKFTNSLVIRCKDENNGIEAEYRMDIKVDAVLNGSIDEILKKMPIPPLNSVGELISNIPSVTNSEDEAWEKLLKHRLYESDTEFQKELQRIEIAIEGEEEHIAEVEKWMLAKDRMHYRELTEQEEKELDELQKEELLDERAVEYAGYVLKEDIESLRKITEGLRLHVRVDQRNEN